MVVYCMTKTIRSVLGANTDSSAPQSSLLRINVGLSSSLDSLSGEVKFSYQLKFHVSGQITAHVLAYTNSCLNPLLYAKMSNNFRRGFSQVEQPCNFRETLGTHKSNMGM